MDQYEEVQVVYRVLSADVTTISSALYIPALKLFMTSDRHTKP